MSSYWRNPQTEALHTPTLPVPCPPHPTLALQAAGGRLQLRNWDVPSRATRDVKGSRWVSPAVKPVKGRAERAPGWSAPGAEQPLGPSQRPRLVGGRADEQKPRLCGVRVRVEAEDGSPVEAGLRSSAQGCRARPRAVGGNSNGPEVQGPLSSAPAASAGHAGGHRRGQRASERTAGPRKRGQALLWDWAEGHVTAAAPGQAGRAARATPGRVDAPRMNFRPCRRPGAARGRGCEPCPP